MIRFRLAKLLKDRELTAYRLSMESGIHQRVLGKYVNNQVREISLDTLNTMCKALRCRVGELIEYVPDKKGK
jgi:putative transcriptional regulator